MSQVLEKRTYDAALYDVICTGILATNETIISIDSNVADQGGLTLSSPAINAVPITYPDGEVAPIGTVIQIQIAGGAIPAGSDSMGWGFPNLLCTCRIKLKTNISNNQKEATVLILLCDQPR